MTIPILDLSCSSQGYLECFQAYVMSILPLADTSLVAYNGATTMEAILNYFKIEMSWRGDLYSSLQQSSYQQYYRDY